MKLVRFHDAARVELLNEVRYYAGISPTLGERLATAVEQATQLASEFPETGSPYKHGTRRVFTRKFPFSVVYVVRGSEESPATGAHVRMMVNPRLQATRMRPHAPEPAH